MEPSECKNELENILKFLDEHGGTLEPQQMEILKMRIQIYGFILNYKNK